MIDLYDAAHALQVNSHTGVAWNITVCVQVSWRLCLSAMAT